MRGGKCRWGPGVESRKKKIRSDKKNKEAKGDKKIVGVLKKIVG